MVRDVPLIPERRPLVDLGNQSIRVHLRLVPHAPATSPDAPDDLGTLAAAPDALASSRVGHFFLLL